MSADVIRVLRSRKAQNSKLRFVFPRSLANATLMCAARSEMVLNREVVPSNGNTSIGNEVLWRNADLYTALLMAEQHTVVTGNGRRPVSLFMEC